jgi:hypothetical protein
MAHIVEDRILESSTTTGTGDFTLAGAVTGFRRFSAVCSVSDTVPYFIEALDSVGAPTGDYEYGLGTYSAANTLTRTTVQGSSNAGAAVDFAAGSKNVGLGLNKAELGTASVLTSGYVRLPRWLGGLIIQWGRQATGTGSGSLAVSVNLPLAYPTAHIVTIPTLNTNSDDTFAGWDPATSTLSVAAFRIRDAAGGAIAANTLSYISIGH